MLVRSKISLFPRLIGHDKHWKWTVAAALLLSFYTYHCYYLTFVHFDYGYNMLANVSVGTSLLIRCIILIIFS